MMHHYTYYDYDYTYSSPVDNFFEILSIYANIYSLCQYTQIFNADADDADSC